MDHINIPIDLTKPLQQHEEDRLKLMIARRSFDEERERMKNQIEGLEDLRNAAIISVIFAVILIFITN
jgi:hypothetical protein